MMLVWSNCALYNKPTSAVGVVGIQARAKFEELWLKSGMETGLRNRRSNRGAPARLPGRSWLHCLCDQLPIRRPARSEQAHHRDALGCCRQTAPALAHRHGIAGC